MRSSSWKDRLGAALSPGAETIELRQRRTDENDHVCWRPMNGAKIRDFRHATFHAYLLSSQVIDAMVRKAERCCGLRTRHQFTWWVYVVSAVKKKLVVIL